MWPFSSKKNYNRRVQIYRKYFTEEKFFRKLLKSTLGLSSSEFEVAIRKLREGDCRIYVSEKEMVTLLKIADKHPLLMKVIERQYDSLGPGETNTDRNVR